MNNCSVEELRKTFRFDANGKLYWLNSGIGRKPNLEAGSLHKATGCYKVSLKRKQYAVHRVIWALEKNIWVHTTPNKKLRRLTTMLH